MSLLNAIRERAAWLGLLIPKGLHKFLMVGMVGLVCDLGLFTLLEHLGVSLLLARAVSIPVATVVTWTLNRRITFVATGRKPHDEALRYFLVTAVAQSVNYGVMVVMAKSLPVLPHLLAAFIGSVVATLFSYTGQRFFTFSPPAAGQTAPDAQ